MTGEELKQQIALYESADHTVHLDVKGGRGHGVA